MKNFIKYMLLLILAIGITTKVEAQKADTKAFTVKAKRFSKTAEEKIVAAGGKVEVV